MEFNLTILPKKYRRDVAERRTFDSLRGIRKVLDHIATNHDKFSIDSKNVVENVQKSRKSLLGYRAVPITRHWRLIWSQDEETKAMQQEWARRIGNIRGHQASWGFRKGRSCHDCCQSHLVYWGIKKPGQLNFVSLDVENFFPSITGKMIEESMDRHGFSASEIGRCLDVCTFKLYNSILWDDIIRRLAEGTAPARVHLTSDVTTLWEMFGTPEARTTLHEFTSSVISTGRHGSVLYHPDTVYLVRELVFRYICGFGRNTTVGDNLLIQGSPASPAMSNLVVKRIDYRMEAMAKAYGAFYSRYADDVTFSWKKRRGKKWIGLLTFAAKKILEEHGFYIRPDKTIIKGPGMRQSMLGYNLNDGRVTVSRARRHRVMHTLKRYATGELRDEGHALESLMGEVEFIATAHPKAAEEMRILGKEAMVRAGTSGRAELHFDQHNADEFVEPEVRPIQL